MVLKLMKKKKLTQQELYKLAKISCLEFDEEFVKSTTATINNILEWVEEMLMVDTTDIQPMFMIADYLDQHIDKWRGDVVAQTATKDDILRNAPETEEDFIVVPKVID